MKVCVGRNGIAFIHLWFWLKVIICLLSGKRMWDYIDTKRAVQTLNVQTCK